MAATHHELRAAEQIREERAIARKRGVQPSTAAGARFLPGVVPTTRWVADEPHATVVMKVLRVIVVVMGVVVVAGGFLGGGGLIRGAALVVAAAVTFVRVILVKEERLLWAVWGVGLLAWTGQLHYVVFPHAAVSFPAVPDYLALGFYGCAMVSVVLFVKSRLHGRRKSLWLDGVIGGLALSALMSLFVFHTALAGSGVDSQIVDGQLGYAIADLFILGFIAVVVLVGGWRVGLAARAFMVGFALLALADCMYVVAVAKGALVPTSLVTSLWAVGSLSLAAAATHRRRICHAAHATGLVAVVLLGFSGMSSLGLLAAYAIGLVGRTPALIGLAAAVLGVTVVRFCSSLLENSRILKASQVQALTDSLTGLRNRRRLVIDLENAIGHACESEPLTLGLFDLDGFKSYNDTFGHPAGDQLLVRLGHKLAAAVADHGTAYRLGGDEFCVLVHGAANDAARALSAAHLSLAERGQHFSVGASCGSARIPQDARDAEAALYLADQRMYGEKNQRPDSARRQSRDVLLKALHERQPTLGAHGQGVTDLAVAVALRAGIKGEQLDELARAAELHDIGKIAIPEAILNKPGPLSQEEWEFMHRHPMLGERILNVAPALKPVAKLVRSSHERWDGNGYPDRLKGHQIPNGSRIIFVCDAFNAMTEERPYHASQAPQEAITELRRCAGTQFDPRAVTLLCQVLEHQTAPNPPHQSARQAAHVASRSLLTTPEPPGDATLI